jgi:hypothetical protein
LTGSANGSTSRVESVLAEVEVHRHVLQAGRIAPALLL